MLKTYFMLDIEGKRFFNTGKSQENCETCTKHLHSLFRLPLEAVFVLYAINCFRFGCPSLPLYVPRRVHKNYGLGF